MARPTEQPASSASISSVSAQRPESRRSQAELAYDLSRLNSQVRRLTLVSVQIVYGRNTSSNNATRSDPKLAQPAKLASVLHPVPHCTHLTVCVSVPSLISLTLHPVRPHISRSLEGSRAGGGADERRAPRHAGAQTIRRGGRLWGVRGRAPCSSCTPARSRVGVVEAPPCPCALAVLHSHRITCRPKGSGRGWTVVEARQLGVGSVSARAWRPDGPGGSG